MLETVDTLEEVFADQLAEGALEPLRERLTQERDELAERIELPELLEQMYSVIERGRERLEDLPWGESSFEDLTPGLEKSYRRGREAMAEAYEEPEVEIFHEWRKRAKYHRYHLRALRELWPPVINAWRDRLHDLTDLLGDDHDLAVISAHIKEDPSRFGDERGVQVFLGLTERRSQELRDRAEPLGRQLFAEAPEAMSTRIASFWAYWYEA